MPLFLFGPVVLLLMLVGSALGALPHGRQTLTSFLEQTAPAPQEAGGVGDRAHLWFI